MASRLVWGLELRLVWLQALLTLLTNKDCKLMLVTRTGAGKSHVFRVIGTVLRGIHLVVHPLLSLAANQVKKFRNGSNQYGAISAINLDKWFDDQQQGALSTLYEKISMIESSTSTTLYIFVSPQRIAHQSALRRVLLSCAHRGTLCSVTLGKAHLHGKHACTF